MKLGSLKSQNSKDGELVLISRDLKRMISAKDIALHFREAIENWSHVKESLEKRYQELNSGALPAIPYDESKLMSALPRTWLFADGSAFIHHIKLVRTARKAALPETILTVPLMYQGESGGFLNPHEEIPQRDFSHGTDFEGEVGVITDFVPMGSTPEQALSKILFCILINDVSLRGLIPEELSTGFGFFQSKPTSALSPVAVTTDELGAAWKNGRIHLPLNVKYNSEFFGRADAGAMHFHFGELVAHAAKTRDLQAGSLIGSGTVSNENAQVGSSCIVEKRTIEQLEKGQPSTPYMKVGETVEMWMDHEDGSNIFGRIFQKVTSRS